MSFDMLVESDVDLVVVVVSVDDIHEIESFKIASIAVQTTDLRQHFWFLVAFSWPFSNPALNWINLKCSNC